MQAFPASSTNHDRSATPDSSRKDDVNSSVSDTNSRKGSSRPPGLPPVKCTTAVMDEGPKYLFELADRLSDKIVFSQSNVRFLPPIMFDRLPGYLLTIDGPFSGEEGDGILLKSSSFEQIAALAANVMALDGSTVEFALLEDKLHHVSVMDPEILIHAVAGYSTTIEE